MARSIGLKVGSSVVKDSWGALFEIMTLHVGGNCFVSIGLTPNLHRTSTLGVFRRKTYLDTVNPNSVHIGV